ncbi:VPLPA-CTERM sorting domain-containing protein [Celeribacter arenosi]|uniref:VPLPA-CTERM protein sorting domain-containing protein n=1 Tax=Celeribacter arenosi TaxID=792649 RepID=A0ABP7KDE5_9RHOB
MKIRHLIGAAAVLFASVTSSFAATYNVVGDFFGANLGDVSFDLTITADFSGNIADTSAGLTINSLTSTVVDLSAFPLQYNYNALGDEFAIGGGIIGLDDLRPDLLVIVSNFLTAPAFYHVIDVNDAYFGSPTGGSLSVTEVPAVPLPAGGVLLLSGLVGFGALRRRKGRTAEV